MKKIAAAAIALVAALTLSACGAAGSDRNDFGGSASGGDSNEESPDSGAYLHAYERYDGEIDDGYYYNSVTEQDFKSVSEEASSYFSLDRNTATYSLVRAQINNGRKVSPDSVRIEEMINYFDYSYDAPTKEAVALSGYLSDCPWNEESKLMLVGLKTREKKLEELSCNYVFLIDISGSMASPDRLELAKTGLGYLVDALNESDSVSLVTYASGVNLVMDGEICTEENKQNIKAQISDLNAYGSTNGSGGLELAYATAESHFIEGGNNRIILISDGDFNVGMTGQSELKAFISRKAQSHIYLSVIGVGMGNLRDGILETLANSGNGNYAYLDNLTEAKKVFTEELDGMLLTLAKDARASVTFTQAVSSYRLIGYDAKILSRDQYLDDGYDTGEIGTNLCVSALYEIKLDSEYAEDNDLLAEVEVRYYDISAGGVPSCVSLNIDGGEKDSDDLKFIACVAEFGLVLRNSAYGGSSSIGGVLARLELLEQYLSADVYKQEFAELVKLAYDSGFYGGRQ